MCYNQRVICTKAAVAIETETEMKQVHQMVEDIIVTAERAIEMNIIIIILHTREEDRGMIAMIAHHTIHDHITMAVDIMTGTKRGGGENHRHIIRQDNIEKPNMTQSIVIITIMVTAVGEDMSMVMNQHHTLIHHHHMCHRTPWRHIKVIETLISIHLNEESHRML